MPSKQSPSSALSDLAEMAEHYESIVANDISSLTTSKSSSKPSKEQSIKSSAKASSKAFNDQFTKASDKTLSKLSTDHSLSDKSIFEFGPQDSDTPKTSDKAFTLTPKFPSDIFSKPPEYHVFDAPMYYNIINLDEFQRSRVTVSSKWETQYDQGGLILVLPKDGKAATGKWIKTGLEFFNDKTFLSTVSKDRWADWNLTPQKGNEVTLEMERKGMSLWINMIDGKKTTPIREVSWPLHEKNQPIWVGVYAAKPKEGGKKDLEVKFKDWYLETIHGVHKGHDKKRELTEDECKDRDQKQADKECDH